jgi:hypothetical protein
MARGQFVYQIRRPSQVRRASAAPRAGVVAASAPTTTSAPTATTAPLSGDPVARVERPYRELQAEAKARGIPANQSREDLEAALGG